LTAPVISTITNTGTLTLPTSTDTLVGRATTDTLTNKTIDSTTNTVTANNIRSATTVVNASAATAPTANQVLTATSGTAAIWRTPDTYTTQEIVSTTNTSTTSTSYVTITSMTVTPASGTYFVSYSMTCGTSNTTQKNCAIHVNGTIIADTERNLRGLTITSTSLQTQTIVTLNGTDVLDIRFSVASGTFNVFARNLLLIKLSP
jgi:hypothetical protein